MGHREIRIARIQAPHIVSVFSSPSSTLGLRDDASSLTDRRNELTVRGHEAGIHLTGTDTKLGEVDAKSGTEIFSKNDKLALHSKPIPRPRWLV